VNISSIGGKVGVPHLVPYCASKFALTGLSTALRAELHRENIVITTVSPGLMRTGSPFNARFKGRHRQEFTWFAVADSMPWLSIDARRAARQIVEAARHGDAELIVGLPARLLVIANGLAPDLVAQADQWSAPFVHEQPRESRTYWMAERLGLGAVGADAAERKSGGSKQRAADVTLER
jgi:short-subunit dehydrogenase